MSEPHVIRLRGPWEMEPLARFAVDGGGSISEATDGLPGGARVAVPCDWEAVLGPGFLGRVRYARRFNCPTNLGPAQRVWLVLEGVDPAGEVTLNGQPLGVAGFLTATRLNLTPWLRPHNILWVDVEMTAAAHADDRARPGRAGLAGGLIGEVRLEIVG
jgi:hypothetical protein